MDLYPQNSMRQDRVINGKDGGGPGLSQIVLFSLSYLISRSFPCSEAQVKVLILLEAFSILGHTDHFLLLASVGQIVRSPFCLAVSKWPHVKGYLVYPETVYVSPMLCLSLET